MVSSEASATSAAPAGAGEDARVPVLERAVWKRLAEARDLGELAPPWIALQCAQIGAERGVVALGSAGERPRVVGAWPEAANVAGLLATAEAAIEQQRGVAQQA